jgi:hypothetical protein
MAITLKQARHRSSRFRLAEVEVLMSTFYQIHLFDEARGHLLVDDTDSPLQLRSLPRVRSLLRQLPLDHAELVHRSAFGEMIGLDDTDNSMRLPIRLDGTEDDPENFE